MKTVKQKVKELYIAGETTRKIKQQLHLKNSQFDKIYCELRDTGEITPRPFKRIKKQKPVKNYSYDRGTNTFQIRKNSQYYCNAKTYRQAERIVELLKECNWDKSKANDIKKQVIIEESVV